MLSAAVNRRLTLAAQRHVRANGSIPRSDRIGQTDRFRLADLILKSALSPLQREERLCYKAP
jgi:hypothetical protein